MAISGKQKPGRAAEYLYVSVKRAGLWELLQNRLAQQLLAANPTDKTIHIVTFPP